MKNVLSVQSSVVYGYAGNKAAVLPMQLSGIDVWPFYTVQFSNHTQYGMWQGMAMPHGELSAIISGLDDLQNWRNAMPCCPGISGTNAIVKR